MTKILGLLLTFIFTVNLAFGSPLVFKTKKTVTTNDLTEIATFDATRYRQVRIAVSVEGREGKIRNLSTSKAVAEIELNAANRELNRLRQLLEEGQVPRVEYDRAADRAKIAQQIFDEATENDYLPINMFGLEGTDEILLAGFDEKSFNRSMVIDSPPSKIRVKVSGKGIYSLYVWATQ